MVFAKSISTNGVADKFGFRHFGFASRAGRLPAAWVRLVRARAKEAGRGGRGLRLRSALGSFFVLSLFVTGSPGEASEAKKLALGINLNKPLGPAMDPMRAMLEIRRPLDAKYPASKPCDGWESKALNPVPTYTVTSHQLILRCADNRDHVITYTQLRKLKLFRISHAKKPANNIAHLVVEARRFTLALYFQELAEARTVANAFYSLAHPTLSARETDAAFEARVESARMSGDRAEVWRRAQVRVETLLAGNRLSEAALLYRDALAVSPDWAQGHYNLALVYGSLEFYPEAITEMRRYLKLEADAPDARAAQDQIYGWEALLSPSQASESGVQ